MGVDDHPILSWNTPPHGYWQEGEFPSNLHNVWSSGTKSAPFDKPFYLILDVAVNGGQFSENYVNQPYPKPWTLHEPDAMQKFWAARHLWKPTWHGEGTAMKIRSVKMQQY
nr:hypothetical protein BaRGS_015858 [Batillaria attramentaria]